MLIGTMNHPARDIFSEIEWMADMGLEFIDLTLEPPDTGSWKINTRAVRAALERRGLKSCAGASGCSRNSASPG